MNARSRFYVTMLLAGGIAFACHRSSLQGAVYTWDGGDGGSWDTASDNAVWLNGFNLLAWSNTASPANDAAFAVTGQTVFVDGPVSVHNMTFTADGNLLYSTNGDAVTLGGSSPTISVTTAGTTAIYAPLAGNSGLTKSGSGTLQLESPNTYGGATTVSGGILRLLDLNALPGGTSTTGGTGNLFLNGGIIELGVADFTRALGTAASQVQFSSTGSGGGFSAVGGNRAVNLGGGSDQVTWGSGGFVPSGGSLVLGSPSDDSTVDFQNPINLNGAVRTVQVLGGFAIVDARLSGALSGAAAGLTINGNGVLELTASNGYSGATTVSGTSVVRLSNSAALPGGTGTAGGTSNLVLDGGVIELAAGDLTRSMGTAGNQVQFTSNGGGFSAYGSDHFVNLGGASAPVTWGSGSFVPAGAALILGSPSDLSMVDFQNPINLGSTTRTVQVNSGFAAVDGQISGAINGSGAAGLTITGNGVLQLTASNAFTGATTVSGATLRLANSAALPGGTGTTGGASNLVLDGGVIELAAGDFTRALGTAASQVQFTANGGGFSAVGANRNVNLGGAGAQLTWGSGGFLTGNASLTLSSGGADSTVNFQNPIQLSSSTGTVDVVAGTAPVDAQLSGAISGSGTAGLTITGNGVLELTASNGYSGATTVSGPYLRLSNSTALPGGIGATGGASNLVIDGGVIELAAGDFSRGIGTSVSQVQFTSNGGGFSAVGANRNVNLGGAGAQVTWSSGNFLPNNAPLILGSPGADSTIIFQNPIRLNSSTGTVDVVAGSAVVDARLSGAISGSGTAGLSIVGNGVLDLTASNGYAGATTVSGVDLRLSNSAALPGGTAAAGGLSNLVLDGGIIELAAGDFSRGTGTAASQVQFTSNGGGFSAVGGNRNVNLGGASAQVTWGDGSFVPLGAPLILGSPGADSTVIFQNPINLGSSTGTIQVNSGSATVDARLAGTLSGSGTAGLTKTGAGTLDLVASDSYTGATTVSAGIVRLTNSGALPGGTATAGGTSNLVLDGGVVELAASDFTRGLGYAASQVQFTSNGGGFAAVGGNRAVNLGGASAQVTWGSGGFVPVGAALVLGSVSSDSMVDFQNPINLGSTDGTVDADAGSAPVAGRLSGALSGSGGLVKAGFGTLELTASNSYGGGTTVSAGILQLGGANSLGSGSLAINANAALDLQGYSAAITALSGSGTIANSATGSSSAATLTVTAGGIFAGTIQDGGLGGNAPTGLLLGGGVLTLSGSNTYTDGTVVNGGSLVVANAYSLLDGSNLTVGNATAFMSPIVAGSARARAGTRNAHARGLWPLECDGLPSLF